MAEISLYVLLILILLSSSLAYSPTFILILISGLHLVLEKALGSYYSINTICQALGPEKSKALPFFHAFTGSDTTSQFHGKGKKSAWDAWKSYQEATMAFVHITEQPFQQLMILQSQWFDILERFTCVLYDKSTTLSHVNELRQEMFSRKSKTMENIPPTQVNAHQF